MREALDLVDIIRRDEFAAAALGEIGNTELVAQPPWLEVQIQAAPGRIFRKSRMRLVENAGLDVDFINAVRDLPRARRQFDTRTVEIAGLGNGGRGRWDQRVGPFEIVILQRRLVHLPDEVILVGGIRLRRVQMLGALGKGTVENVLAGLARRIGIVPNPAAAGEQDETAKRNEKTHRPSLAEPARGVTPV